VAYHFDHEAAQLAVDFIQLLKHSKGEYAGQYFTLQPWQEDIIRELFGWKCEDGSRRYRKLILEIGRGNGKTALAAAIALYMLFVDPDAKPEVYSAAADKEQAGIAYQFAADMIHASPALRAISNTTPHKKQIVNMLNGGVFRALSSDGSTKHGTAPNCILLDELHAWTKPGAIELLDALQTGLLKRRNSLQIIISTAGHNLYSIFGREVEYARAVRDGKIKDDTILVRLFEADPKDPIDDPATWHKANPNLGVSIHESDLAREAEKAKTDPWYRNKFLRLHLNIWTTTETEYIPMLDWDASAGVVDVEQLQGRKCFAGLDLSTKEDLTAFVLLFPFEDGTYKVLPYFFMPLDNMQERIKTDGVAYDDWANDPDTHLTPTEGNSIDYSVVMRTILEAHDRFDIQEIAYDKAFSNFFAEQLVEHGLTVVPITQTPLALSEATMELKRLVQTKALHHGNNPVLRWNANCTSVYEGPTGLVKLVKPKRRSTRNRIDGVAALVFALVRALVHKPAPNMIDNLIAAYQ